MMDKNLYKSDSILKKRIRKFKTIKRAYYSLIILIIAYIFSLSASIFVNSTALIVRYTNNISLKIKIFHDFLGWVRKLINYD